MNDLSHSRLEPGFRSRDPVRRNVERIPLIRTAKLILESGEYPCVLRDISGNALRVKLFGTQLPEMERTFWLEFGDGERFDVSLIWVRDGQAGLAFTEHNNLLSMIGEHGPFRKRAIRIAVDLPATVASLGLSLAVLVRDLSHQGAQIESETRFSMDQQVRIAIPSLGEVYAKVRWRKHPHYGLAFVETFRFEDIAEVAGHLQALSRIWRESRDEQDRSHDDPSGIAT